jgi:glycine/D-amino acid oxidase-like deaminating enzyme/nitrite reductase/ring-hydroxylating ferredoxin subunit
MGPNPPLGRDLSADVCIIGAGIAGLTTGYLLGREGKKVILLDDGPTAGGETCRTTAHLTCYIDDGLAEIERLHGLDGLRIHWQSHRDAIDRIEQIVRELSIDCDFARVDGYLFPSPAGKQQDYLATELETAHRIGWKEAQWADQPPLPGAPRGRALRFPNQGMFHPLKYFRRLAEAIQQAGGQIFNHTHATQITGGKPARVETNRGATITCDAVVVATNSPVNDLVAIHTKQAPYRTYVIACRVPKGSVPAALYWDTCSPYHYLRIQPADDQSDHFIIGGEDCKTGHADEPEQHAKLERWAREQFPFIQSVDFRWSGQVMEPVDGVAFIGPNPLDKENVFIATGDSGMGMTHGTIAGILLTELIQGRSHPWAALYKPNRISLKSLPSFMSENLDVAGKYARHLTGSDVSSEDQIPPDSGAVIQKGLHKLAVYRDASGQLHRRSAVCSHLGCVVVWNALEKSWDCPCHGSRFAAEDGHPVNGPALGGLSDPAT